MHVVFLIIILFIRERERQKIMQREKQAPHQEPNMGLDPRLQDHTLSQRQRLNPWATQASRIHFLSYSDTLYLFIGAFSLSAFRVIIHRYELCAFVFPEELVFLVTFSEPFSSLLLLVSFFPPLEESLLKFLTGLVKWSWTPLYVACLGKSFSLLLSCMTPLLKKELIQIGLQ